VLTAAQRTAFDERGLVHLPGFVAASAIAGFRERLLAFIRARGLAPDPAPPGFVVTPSHTAKLAKRHGFTEIWGARAPELIDDVLGAGEWIGAADAGQLLFVSYPSPDVPWILPHKSWHLDFRAPGACERLPALQLFLCVDRIEPRGGGTLVVCGVHRLIDALRRAEGPAWPGRSQDIRRKLAARVPWLRELASVREGEDRAARFMREPTLCDGVPLQVAEIHGEAGDLFVMHPWMLHSLSQNCGTRPRLVLTTRALRKGGGFQSSR
jgi:hypothetical protein